MTEDLEASVPGCGKAGKHLRLLGRHDAYREFACAGRITNPSPLPPMLAVHLRSRRWMPNLPITSVCCPSGYGIHVGGLLDGSLLAAVPPRVC